MPQRMRSDVSEALCPGVAPDQVVHSGHGEALVLMPWLPTPEQWPAGLTALWPAREVVPEEPRVLVGKGHQPLLAPVIPTYSVRVVIIEVTSSALAARSLPEDRWKGLRGSRP
jgi:hypothetical protein